MAVLSYQQISVTTGVQNSSVLTIPQTTQYALLQAETISIRYTMDGKTAPNCSGGMILLANTNPQVFRLPYIQNIQFISSGANTVMDIQYFY